MRAARVFDVVNVEGLIVGEHIRGAGTIPRLAPDEIPILFSSEPLLPRVVYSLDHRAGCTRCFQEVGYGAAMAKRIDGPA